MQFFAIFVLCCSAVLSAKLPEGTKSCRKSDPNFIECLKDAITDGFKRMEKGFRPLGIVPIDPVEVPELQADKGGISQTYKNVKMYGISNCKVKKIKINWDTLEWETEALTPQTVMEADYAIKGQLLTFPIDSSGKCKITMDSVISLSQIKMERFQKKGKNYLRVVDWKLKNIPAAIRYEYDNIVPDNEQLSNTIIKTMNDNALQLYEDFGTTFSEAYAQLHIAVANKVFEKIPEDELFLP